MSQAKSSTTKRKLSLKGIWKLIKESIIGFDNDKVFKLSGSLAYFTVFSIGPMMLVIIFLADLFYGREAVEGTIYGQINGFVGPAAAAQIQEIIKNASMSGKSTLTAVIGFITLLVGTTTVFAEIQDSINTIWNLKTKPEKGWIKIILNRLLSFSIVVGLAFLLLVSLIINGVMEAFGDHLANIFPQLAVLVIYIINLVLTFVVIKWKDVIIGAIVTALLFMLGKFGITYYIGSSNIGSTYGAAGSLIILLLWVYYSAIILYFGAEFTKAYAVHFGNRIYPNSYAVWIKHVDIEEEKKTLKQEEHEKKSDNNHSPGNIKVT
jgi:membrane protein